MRTSQSFPFYPTDFLIGTMFMTPAQVGGYIRALCYQWESGGFPTLPEDQKRVTGCGDEDLKIILGKFIEKRGVLVNKRMEEVRRARAEYAKTQRENGKKGGRPKQNPSVSIGLSQTKPKKSLPFPSPLPSPSPIIPPVSPEGDAQWFESLKTNAAYAGIDIAREFGKCRAWCAANKKQCSRRRFVNWLNRAERPIHSNGTDVPAHKKY